MTIGDRVRARRIEKGMTQSELAQRLGYKSKSSVAHIENGRDIPRAMIVELSEILDTTPGYLMGWNDEQTRPETITTEPLTGDERRLLDLFRQLTPKEQGNIIGRAELLAEQHREAETEDAG